MRRLAAAIAGTALLAGSLLTGPGAAEAQAAPAPAVTVTIASVTPAVATQNGDVTITGQVANVSAGPVTDARAVMWTASRALTTSDALTAALASPPTGSRVTRDPRATAPLGVPASPTSTTGVLDAGANGDFSVTAAMIGTGMLGMSAPDAVYLIGVQVLGRVSGGAVTVLARSYCLVSYVDADKPVQWAQVVQLSDAPSLLRPATDSDQAVFADDHLATDLSGRLQDLLTAALRPGVTVLVDPSLWDEVTAMAQGYQVQGADGTLTPGTGQQAAKAWLSAAAPLLTRASTYRTLYGDPDVALAASAARADVLNQTDRPLTSGNALAQLPLAVLPRDGQCDAALLAYLAPAAPARVICRNQTADQTLTTSGGMMVLGVTAAPDAGTTLAAWPGAQQGLFDAEALLRSLDGQPVAVLGAGPTPSPELPNRITADLPDATTESQFAAPATPARAASPDLLTATTAAEHDLTLAGVLSDQTDAASAQAARVVGGLWSCAWSPDDSGLSKALAWANQIVAPVTAQVQGGVQLRIASEVHLSASDSPMPVTVVNDYAMPIIVRVNFHSDNAQRLTIPDSDLVKVDPGESALVRVSPQASGNGAVDVQATVTSASGQALTAPVEFVVNTTAAGRLGWIIVIAAGIAFLVATTLRVRQVRRARAGERSARGDSEH